MSFQLLIKTAQPPGPVTGATAAWTSPNTYVSCSWTPTQQYGGVPTITYTVVFYSSPTTNPANGTIVETFTGLSLSTTSSRTITTTLVSGTYYFAIIYAVNTARTSIGTTTNVVNPSFASVSAPSNVGTTWNQYDTFVTSTWYASNAPAYQITFYSTPSSNTTGGTLLQTIYYAPFIYTLPTIAGAGLSLWLDSADQATLTLTTTGGVTTVSAWKDKSSNAYTMTAASSSYYPTLLSRSLNNQSVLSFSGGQYLTGTVNFTSPNSFTLFIIYYSPGSGYTAETLFASGDTSNAPFGQLGIWAGGGLQYQNTFQYGSTFSTGSSYRLVTTVVVTPATNTAVYFNGALQYGWTSGYGVNLTGNIPSITIGATATQAYFFSGNIAEIVLYSTALSTSNQQLVEGYLAWKWGLQSSLPNTHPYYSVAPPAPTLPVTNAYVSQNTTTTLTLNTYYYSAVQAQDSSGKYTAYTISSNAVCYYVLPPTNVAIAYDLYHTYVTASWTGITNALTVTYTVNFYQNSTNSTSGGSLYNTITGLSVGTTSQITTNTLNFGNYYYATVAAYELGVSSAVITSSTAVLYYIPYPTNFTMVWNGTSYVYATWTIDTFSLPIYYTINFYTSGANVLSGGSLVQTFTNIGSSSNSQLTTTALSYNQYYYATIYTTISGTSSNSITVTTSNNVYYYFTPPTSVSLAWTNSYIYLTASWTYATINPAYTTLYNIYFYWNSTNASTGGTLVQTVLGTSNNYQNTTVTLSNGYYYAIVNSSNSVGTTSANVTTNVVNYAPTYWLTLGSGNNALMKSQSYSGITYYADGNPFGSTGYAAAWNGAIWVAVGSATNTISYSYDGVTWNGLGAGTFNAQGRGVAWNGSLWVAVGSAGNTIAYSSTGTSWNGAGLVFSTVGYGIAWNGSIWVAVGQGASAIYTSANGASWTASSNQSAATFTTSANGGVWNGSIWVVGGSGTNTIATSVDGSVWISRGIVAGSTTVWCVAWSGSYFIAACAGTSPVITSPDGITWTGRTASGLTVGYFITVQNSGIWVLSGQGSSTIFTCTDGTGVTWTARTANTIFTTCYSVCYNGNFNYWIGVGTGTYSIAYSSTNAQTWTGASTINSIIGVGYGVTCDGGTWIAVGSYQSQGNFTMATSTNGSSWTGFTAAWNARSVMQQLRSINYINNLYIVTGQGGAVYYSTSLTSNAWVSGAANPLFGPSTTVYNIAWNGNYSHYLAFSSLTAGVTVGLSPDLYSWASVAQIMFATAGYSITWNGSYFLATGQGTYNTLARSTDGYGWRGLGVYCFPTVAYSAAWNSQNSVWAVVGQGGVASIWTSGDGYNFYPRTSMIYATTFNSVRYQYTANMFTAVGTGGMIVRAYGAATTWQPTMQTAAWTNYNLTYGNGNWIASGASGFIVSSNVYEAYNDGAPALTDWVPRSIYTIFTTQVNGFAWNNTWNYWLAFGSGTYSVAISMDGINWTGTAAIASYMTSGGYAGIWHSGLRLWIVGGTGTNPYITSFDGYTWTVRTPGNLTAIYTVATDGYMILMGGTYSSTTCIASSWDGVTWTNRVASSLTTPYQIIWDQAVLTSGQFIAVGAGTTYPINVSSNGITWTNNTGITTTQIATAYGIVWTSGFGSFVMVGQPGIANIFVSAYYNLSSWSNYSAPYVVNNLFSGQGYGVAWNGSSFVLVGSASNSILYSADGIKYYVVASFNSGTSAPGGQIFTTQGYAVIWNANNGIWIACGSGNCQIAYGYGYGGWGNLGNSFFPTSGYCLATNGGRTICGGGAGGTVLWYSDNGTSWGASANGTSIISSSVFSAVYGTNGIWIAGGQGGSYNLAYSPDGYNWYGASNYYGNAVSYITYCLGWNGSYFLAGGNCVTTYQFAISFNGSNWQNAGTIPFSTAARCVAWSSTLAIWVAGGQGANTLAWSWDGVNWVGLAATIFSTICYGVTWNGSIFVATGSGTNTVATSFDGSNWIPRGNYYQFTSYARGVAYNPGTNAVVIGGTGGSNTLNQTTDLVGYNYFGSTVFTTGCYAVAWNGSYFLAGGSGLNTIASSPDGYTWTGRANTSTSVAMRAAGWNGSYWIGVGATGSLSPFYRSADTLTWYQTTSYNPGTVYGVQWNGSYWLATSAANQVYQSSNGSFWIVRNTNTTPFSGQVNAVVWNGSYWVALGTGGTNTVATSTNGFFWIGHGIYPFSTAGWNAAWNGSYWVAVGAGTNTLAWSSNGSNWIGVGATVFTTAAYGVAWSPNLSLWVATGTGTNTIATSYTGLSNSWTARNTYLMQIGYGITWQGSYWVAVGSGTGVQIGTSPDGLVWTAQSSNAIFTTAVYAVAWNGSLLVAVGAANPIATSSDGVNWFQRTFTGFTTGYGVVWAYNLSLWIVVGAGGTYQIGTSGDGVNWTGQNPNNVFTTAAYNAAWNGSYWVGVGNGTNSIVSSANGITWTPRGTLSATYFSTGGSNVIWSSALSQWVAVGAGTNAILTSPDGVTWTIRQVVGTAFGTGGYGVTYNTGANTQYVAVGGPTYWVQVSPDGCNWTITNGSNTATTNIFALTTGPTGFMAVGNSATYLSAWSSNGWNWSNTATGLGAAVQTQCVASINGYWIAGTTANLYYGTSNGSNNTAWTAAVGGNFYAAAASSTIAVAVTTGGTYYWSSNGTSWTALSNVFTYFSYILYANGLFIGTGSYTGYSSNGITWYPSLAAAYLSASYGASIYVIGGASTILYSSSTGLSNSWTAQTSQLSTSTRFIVWDSYRSMFVATGAGVNIFQTSGNGTTWTATHASSNFLYTTGWYALYANSSWTIVGGAAAANTVTIVTTPDGVAFSQALSNAYAYTLYSIAWNGSYYVAVGNYTNTQWAVFYATNPALGGWTSNALTVGAYYGYGVAWNGSYFCTVGGSGSTNLIFTSTSGTGSWLLSSNTFSTMTYVTWTGWNLWIGVGTGSNAVAYSYDGVTWVGQGLNTWFTTGYGVVYNGQNNPIALAVGTGTWQVIYTTNGTTWTGLSSSGVFTTAYSAVFNYQTGSFFIVGTGTYSLAYAYWNGSTMFAPTGIPNTGITTVKSIAINGTSGSYLVVCANTTQLWYLNGSYTWTNSGTAFASSAQAIAWNGTYFVAVGLSAIYYSSTGTSWTSTGSGALSYYSIAWNGTYWLAGYQNTTSFIAYSSTGTSAFTTGITLISTMAIPYFLFWATTLNGGSGGWVATGSGSVSVAINYNSAGTGTWTSQGAPITTGYGISYNPNNGVYMLVGNGANAIYTSTNCSNWTGYTGTTLMTTAYTVVYESASGSNIWCVGGVGNCSFMFTTDQLGQKDWNISYSNFRHATTFFMVDSAYGPVTCGNGPNIAFGGYYSGNLQTANTMFTTGYAITIITGSSGGMIAVGSGGSNTILYNLSNGNFNAWSGAGIISLTTQGRGVALLSNNSINGIYPILALGSGTYFSVMSLDTGISWSPPPTTSILYALAWNGSYWSIGGTGGNTTIMVGNSGSYPLTYFYGARCWSLFTSVYGVCWNGNSSVFVAVGQGNNTVAISSDNGVTWRGRGAFGPAMYAIAWNGSYYVMTGQTATYYSTDAYTWTAATHPFTGIGYAVIWDGNNGRWMLGGNGTGTTIATSTLSPPSSWTAVASASVMGAVRGLGWNGSYYVAVGNGTNNIAWSQNSTSWNGLSTTYLTASGYAVYWYNNAWIAVGSGTYNVAWSTNTVNWFNPIFQTNLRGFGWNGSYWIGVGAGGTTLAYASSWNSWSNIASNASYITGQGYTAVWNPNGNYWLACGTGTNAIVYSANGTSWQVVSLTSAIFTTGCYGLAWNGSIWVAVGQGTTYVNATSSDGVNWTGRNILNTIFAAAYGITWNGTLWVALGTAGSYSIAYSYNGTTWFGVPGSANIFSTGYYVVWNGSYFVGVGTGTYCTAYSSDGVNWFGKSLAASLLTTAYGVAWNGSIWVAVGQPGQSTIAYSYDGNLWQASVNGLTAITTTGYAIQWNGSYFMMSGLNGVYPQVTYSSDGVTWSVYQSASFSNQSGGIYAITSGANGLLAVGAPGVSFAAQSYEGLTWWNYSNVVTPFTTLGTGAATNGSYILATGTGTTNSIAWSLDGTYWFGKGLLIAPSGSACNVAWNGSYWLIPTIYAAATLPGFAVRTYDNSNYDYVGIPGWTAGWNITNIGGTFAAVGSNTSLRNPSYSANGIGWTTRYSAQVLFTIIGTSVSSNNGIWIVTGTGTNSHAYAYQSNGPWNVFPIANFFSTGAYGVAWNGTTWVMVGQGTTNTQITSSNGVVWIGRGISVFSTAGYSVNWNGSIFLATGTGTNITAISSDGLTWDITGKLPFSTGYYIATNSNGIYAATGVGVVASNAFAWSTDGSNWKQRVSSNTMFLTQGYSIVYNSNYSYWLAFGAGTNYVVKSTNGYDWFSQPWYGGSPLGITWNGSYFIGVGSGSNTIAYSSDGSNWYVATNTNIFTTSYCIAWNANNSFWVAGGTGNYVSAYSTNTSNFTGWATNLSAAWQIHSPFSSIWGIAWNQGTNTLWVAAGAGTYTLGTSTDGSNWIGRSSTIFTSQGYTVGWNGTYWLSGGAGTNTIALSPDGSNWAVQATTSLFSTACYVILWNGSYWVAGGQGTTTIAYGPSISSTNSNWYSVCTTSATMFTTSVGCLGWNGSYWLAGGTGGTQLTAVSSNGSNWWPQPFPGYGRGAAYNGSYWVAVGSSGSTIIKSSDAAGQLWFPVSSNTIFTAANAVAWNGSYWVVGGTGNYRIATSSDGVTWTPQTSATSIFGTAVYCLAWNSASNIWVAGGLGATYVTATSTDGVNWYGQMTTATLTAVWGVANNNYSGSSNLWVATGTGGYTVAYSYNGSNWNQNTAQSLFSTQGYGVAFSSTLNVWLVGGAGSFTTWTSQDGIWWFARTASGNSTTSNYTGQPILFTTACYGVTWAGSQFIAFGAGSPYTIATSVNGIAWFPNSNTTYPTFSTWYAVGYGNGIYIGLGVGAVSNIGIANSINGTAWALKTFIPFTSSCAGVAWNGSIWVAVGSGTNTFCTSADGVTWTPYGTLTQPFTTLAGGGAWNGVNWLAAGSGTNTIASSVDGNWWIGKGAGALTSGSNVLYANGFITYGSSTNYQVNTADLFNFNIVRKPDATTVYTLTSSAGGGAGLSIQWYQTTTGLPNVVFPPNAANGWGTLVLSGITTQILYGDGQPQPLGTYTVTGNSNDVGMYAYGFFNSPVADVLYVQMVVDDGGYVNINGVNVLNGWASQGPTQYNGQANISAGANTIQILYSQGGGGATDQFYWQTNSSPGWKSNLAANFTSSAGGFGTMGTGGLAQPFYSSDGIGWYSRYTTYAITTTNVYYITTVNGISYMVGYAGSALTNPTINYSADGYVWVAGALGGIFGTSIFTYTIGYINGVYVIGATAGSHTVAISYDGFTWIPRGTVIFATTAYALLTSGSYLYAGGQGTDFIAKTLDGSNWDVVGNRVFTSSYGITWGSNTLVGSNLYVAVGASNFAAGQCLAYSYDGVGWATRINVYSASYSLFTSAGYASTFVPSGVYASYWIAVGAGTNTTLYSYDGLRWWPPALTGGGQFSYWSGTYSIIGGAGGTSLIYGTNGSNFRPGSTAATFARWWGVGWNGSLYVGVGTPGAVNYGNSNSSNTSIAYSTDLQKWYFAPFTTTIFATGAYGVCWSPSLSIWVAVGQGTYTTAISLNGSNWVGRATTALFTTAGYSVLWNSTNNIFVAVGYGTGTTIATSPDGSNWTAVATTTLWGVSPAGGYGIAWNSTNNTYVAVGISTATMSNSIAYCPNGNATGWVGAGSNIFTTAGWGVAWNGSMWLAVGQGTNTIAYSVNNGVSWFAASNSTSVFSTAGYGVSWTGSLWVITGTGTNMVAYSAYGSNGWVARTTIPFTTGGYGVNTNGTTVVAAGAGTNSLATSYDGLLWVGYQLSVFPATGYGVAYGNGYFIASGATNIFAYSSDGSNWNVVSGRPLLTQGQGVAYNGSLIVAVGTSAVIPYTFSYDGVNWQSRVTYNGSTTLLPYSNATYTGGLLSFNSNLSAGYGVCYNGNTGQWVAVGSASTCNAAASIVYSPDGINWFSGFSNLNNASNIYNTQSLMTTGYGVVWSGTLYVAVGACNVFSGIAYSYNGSNWFGINAPNFVTGRAVAWNGSYFIAVGAQSTNIMFYSADGINWETVGRPLVTTGYNVTWNSFNNSFILLGTGATTYNSILYSYDGFGWRSRVQTTYQFSTGYAVNCNYWAPSNANYWLAGGAGQPYMTSYDGINWYSPFSYGYGVSWNGSYFLAFGGLNAALGSTIILSYDGFIWYNGRTGNQLFTTVKACLWNSTFGYWLAVGLGAVVVAYSTNGLDWTARVGANQFFGSLGANGIVCTGSQWLVLGSANGTPNTFVIIFSSDSYNWYSSQNATNVNLFTVGAFAGIWNGSIYVVTGQGTGNTIATSPDGSNWFAQATYTLWSTATPAGGYGIAWNGGSQYVVVGYGPATLTNTIAYSVNGSNWIGAGVSAFTTAGYGVIWASQCNAFVAVGNGTNSIAYSINNGSNWTVSSALVLFTNGARGLAYDGTKFVVTGPNGTSNIATSTDLINWIGRSYYGGYTSAGTMVTQYSVVWNNSSNFWFSGGNSAQMLFYSMDGLMWLSNTSYTNYGNIGTAPGYALGCNGSYWIMAGGTAGNFYLSKDGFYWVTVAAAPATNYQVMCNGTTLWGASGTSFSYDGIGWCPVINSPLTGYGIAYNGNSNRWVAVAATYTSVSVDGSNYFGSAFTTAGRAIFWDPNNAQFMAVGISAYTQILYGGAAGNYWYPSQTARQMIGGAYGLWWDGSYYTVVGASTGTGATMQWSTDRVTWHNCSNSYLVMSNMYGITKGYAGRWVIAGQGSNTVLAYTNNLVNYVSVAGFTLFTIGYGVYWNGSLFIAVGSAGSSGSYTIASSPDGINWTGRANNALIGTAYCVTWNANYNLWVAGGSPGTYCIATSPDGLTWTGRATSSLFSTCYGVVWGIGGSTSGGGGPFGMFVAVGAGTATIATSFDGFTWTIRATSTLFSVAAYGVAFSGSTWVVVGGLSNTVATSSDGDNWMPWMTVPFSAGTGYAITYSSNYNIFVATGSGSNTLPWSYDGFIWQNTYALSGSSNGLTTFATQGWSIAWTPNAMVASGTGNNVFAATAQGQSNWRAYSNALLESTSYGVATNG